ncbi:hypothetical protein BJ165DRAFT_914988 [Panaeolus papilionaceus]|nr:hypothetical protein BJ165DRAFT_914988 [Panaeolus papilionaceus]
MIFAGLFFILRVRKRDTKQKAGGPLQDRSTVTTPSVNVRRPSLAYALTNPTSTTLDGISSTGTPVLPSASTSWYPSPTNIASTRHPHDRQTSISSQWPSREDAPPPPYMASNPSDSPHPSSNQLSS